MNRLLLLTCLVAGAALADIPPTDTSGCAGKTENAACERDDKSAGVCSKSTCGRNDYSQGVPPKHVSYECLKCTAAPAAAPTSTEAPKETPKSNSCAAIDGGLLAGVALLLARRRR